MTHCQAVPHAGFAFGVADRAQRGGTPEVRGEGFQAEGAEADADPAPDPGFAGLRCSGPPGVLPVGQRQSIPGQIHRESVRCR